MINKTQMKLVTITIAAETNSGKSNILYALKKCLKDSGFDVQFEGGLDFTNEFEFDSNLATNNEKALAAIKERTAVKFVEVQLKQPHR